MTTKEFVVRETLSADTKYIEHVKQTTFDHIDSLLGSKGAEYSSDTNRFENFLDAGRTENMPPEHALWYMMLKHFISIRKFVMALAGPQRWSIDKWSEKIDDAITYLILLKAMIRRRTHIEEVVDQGRVNIELGKDMDTVATEEQAEKKTANTIANEAVNHGGRFA